MRSRIRHRPARRGKNTASFQPVRCSRADEGIHSILDLRVNYHRREFRGDESSDGRQFVSVASFFSHRVPAFRHPICSNRTRLQSRDCINGECTNRPRRTTEGRWGEGRTRYERKRNGEISDACRCTRGAHKASPFSGRIGRSRLFYDSSDIYLQSAGLKGGKAIGPRRSGSSSDGSRAGLIHSAASGREREKGGERERERERESRPVARHFCYGRTRVS